MSRKHRWMALLALGLPGVLYARDPATWLPADTVTTITRTGDWQRTSHRYAAEPALATTQDGATLAFPFRGRALVLGLDTLTPPNNYGPPELGALEVFVDDVNVGTVRPREAANEVTLVRFPDEASHQVRLVHRTGDSGTGARIRGFRMVTEPSGDLAFVASGEQNGSLIDARAILTQDGRVVRDTLVRNWLTGACRLAGLPPGDHYTLELRAAGWKTFRHEGIAIHAGQETRLPAVYLKREHMVGQDAFPFPAFGQAVVRQPGGTFRTRFEAPRAEIRGARLVRQAGPATISRRGAFAEDKAAAFYYHREGTVTLPADTPPGLYDLEITVADERGPRTLTSPRSVAVVAEFPADPRFVSWGHLDTWGQYQAEYVEQLAAIANLLAADMVLVSNEANPAYAAGALRDLAMPFVINFGNHRGPDPGPWFGAPVGAVDFGSAFSVLNFGYPWDRDPVEADQLLAARAATRTKIINAYEANAPVGAILDRHGIALIHYAHGPGPVVATVGATPTIRVGKSNSESFRVIRFKDGRPVSYTYRGHATAPWPFPRGSRPPLGVTYTPANDGTQRMVTARFHNDLGEPFPNARATFVLPPGAYRVTGGRVEHTVPSDDARFTVLTVRFDLPAETSGTVVVQP